MTLRRRLAFVVAAFVILVFGATLVITWAVWARSDRAAQARRYAVTTESVARLGNAFRDQETGQRGFILTGNDEFLTPYQDGITAARSLDASIRLRLRNDKTVLRELDDVSRAGTAWRNQAAQPQIDARRQNGPSAAPGPAAAVVAKGLFDEVRAALDRLGQTVDQRYQDQLAASRHLYHVQVGALITALALIAGLLGFATWAIRRWVTRPLDDIAAAVSRVGVGELQTPIPREGPADVKALAGAVDDMRQRLVTEIDHSRRARQAVEQRASIVLELQAVLTPQPTDIPDGWIVAAGLRPAEGLLAGDCYDVLRLDADTLAVMVLDIAGHGAVAALTALRCREVLRAALRDNPDPGLALGRLDPLSDDLADDLFVTVFVAVIDHRFGTLHWANAGHPPALSRRGADVVELGKTGPAIGPFPGTWATAVTTVEPGGQVVLYTDGLPEARGPEGFFGQDRLAEAVASGPDKASELTDHLLTIAVEHAGGRLADDATALVVRRDDAAPVGEEGAGAA